MRHLLLCVLIWTSIIPLAAAEVFGSEADIAETTIRKIVDAYGGKEIVDEIKSVRARGRVKAFVLGDSGSYEFYFNRDRKLRVETRYEKSWEVRILNGDKGYRSSKTLPLEEVSGVKYLSMLYQYKHINLLSDLAKNNYRVNAVWDSRLNGRLVQVLTITDADGAVMDIYVDPELSTIVKVTAFFSEQGKKIDLSSEFSDFRKVGRTLFPFSISNYAAGRKIGQTDIQEYQINADIPESFFTPSLIESL